MAQSVMQIQVSNVIFRVSPALPTSRSVYSRLHMGCVLLQQYLPYGTTSAGPHTQPGEGQQTAARAQRRQGKTEGHLQQASDVAGGFTDGHMVCTVQEHPRLTALAKRTNTLHHLRTNALLW